MGISWPGLCTVTHSCCKAVVWVWADTCCCAGLLLCAASTDTEVCTELEWMCSWIRKGRAFRAAAASGFVHGPLGNVC